MAHQPKIKAHSLTGRITFGLMQEAFKAVQRNRGAAGIDKVSIQMFAAWDSTRILFWIPVSLFFD